MQGYRRAPRHPGLPGTVPAAQNDDVTLGQIRSKGKDFGATTPVLGAAGFLALSPEPGSQAHSVEDLETVTMTAGPLQPRAIKGSSKSSIQPKLRRGTRTAKGNDMQIIWH